MSWFANLLSALRLRAPGVESALVERVLDGDSIRLTDGREVRYIGIDAPETGAWEQEKGWGQKAKAANARLVEGRRVRLASEAVDRDAYGRLLRHVYVRGVWVNGRLVAWGLARVRTYPPNNRHERELLTLQAQAQRRGRGLWPRRPWWKFW